jgi:Carboxypeptidase regulatory-like domain
MSDSMSARIRCVMFFGLAVLLALPAPARAQSTATLQGIVSDAQGAVMPGVTITILSEQTGAARVVVSDATGSYLAAALPPGRYKITAHLEGFRDHVQQVDLQVAQTIAVNVKLAVGGIAEQVEVIASTPVIETTTTSVGQVISARTVQEIPLNGRHFVDLGLLIPGSVTPPQNGFLTAPLRGQGSFAFNTAGNREDTVNFMINGVNLNDMVQNQITFQPSINTVSEFKVDNSTFSAEYGRNSGAIVNIATRSGSNDLHGEAFEFYRNDTFDSRNFFNQPPAGKSPFNRNQFGGNFGGPIAKNRLFFFGSYEGLRQRQGIDINSGVLRDDQRAAVTDPISLKLLQFIPVANTTGASGEGRYVGAATAPVNIDQGTGDVSYSSGQSDIVHWYYAWQRDLRGEPVLQGNTIPGFGDTRHSHRQIMTLNQSHVFSPSLVNEARFGFNRINITFSPNTVLNPSDFGINDGITTPLALPQITVQGIGLNLGGPAGFPQGRTDTSFVLSDTASYLHGSHSIKFGGEWRRFSNSNFTSDPGTFQYGSLAAFQTGLGNAFAITLGNRPSDIIEGAVGAFVRDSFRASPSVTVEAGLRYDLNLAPTDTGNRFVVFNAANDTLRQLGSGDKIYNNSHNLQPRVGVIWSPGGDGRTAVRGAYALMVDQPVTNVVTPTTANPPLATPLAVNGAVRLDSALTTALAGGVAPQSVDPNFNSGRVQTWNVNVERQIGSTLGMMVGYFGSKGDRLRISRNLNQLTNGVRPFPTLSSASAILPGGALGNITEITSLGVSHYKGLWVTANERPMKGLQFNASYTLSKSTDYNSLNSQGIVVQDSFNLADSEGPSDFDARHRFVISAIYDLPFTGNRIVEGWQVGLITQAQSGNPINVVTNVGTFTGVANTLRPDLVGDPAVLGSTNQWFNNTVCDSRIAGSCTASSVFALPVSASGVFHFGNLPRNAILGPGFSNTDISLVKNLALTATSRLQFRVEAFNVFNHANLGQPGRIATVGSTSFGVITNTRFSTGDSGSSRQVQFAMKFLF